ncbi:hypothetical protein J6590_058789 [Homalodisca vitripennis]|nr:hypothetical protein J6590_058789 [Homalodisca vitripennis]
MKSISEESRSGVQSASLYFTDTCRVVPLCCFNILVATSRDETSCSTSSLDSTHYNNTPVVKTFNILKQRTELLKFDSPFGRTRAFLWLFARCPRQILRVVHGRRLLKTAVKFSQAERRGRGIRISSRRPDELIKSANK